MKEEKKHLDQPGFNFRDAPCKNCERSGCGLYHNQCEKYLAFKQGRERMKDKKKKETLIYEGIRSAKFPSKTSRNSSKVYKSPKK